LKIQAEKLKADRNAFVAQLAHDASVVSQGTIVNEGTGNALSLVQSALDKALDEHYGKSLVAMPQPKETRGRSARYAGQGKGRDIEIPEFHPFAGKIDGTRGIEEQ
jgi:hypothetical protein